MPETDLSYLSDVFSKIPNGTKPPEAIALLYLAASQHGHAKKPEVATAIGKLLRLKPHLVRELKDAKTPSIGKYTKIWTKRGNMFLNTKAKQLLYYLGHPDAKNMSPAEINKITGHTFAPKGQITNAELREVAKLAQISETGVKTAFNEMKKEGIFKK